MARGNMLLKTNEEMGEAGLAVHQTSQIEPSSIFAPGYSDACEQYGCKLSAPFHDIMGKSKEISQNLRKKWKTSTSLVHPWEQFPNAWRYHVHLYKQYYVSISTMAPRSHHTTQKGDAFYLLEMNVLLCEKCKSIPEQQQRTLWRFWRKQAQKYLYPQ